MQWRGLLAFPAGITQNLSSVHASTVQRSTLQSDYPGTNDLNWEYKVNYQAIAIYLICLLGSAVLVGCATGAETHKEGYYVVLNSDAGNRMCCTPEGFVAAKRAISEHDEATARSILFHTNADWRSLGWRIMNGTKYYAYGSHLHQGGTDSAMAEQWEAFNQAFGYSAIPWLADKIARQRAEAELYWKESLAASRDSAATAPSLVAPTPPPATPRSTPGGSGAGVCTSNRADFIGFCKDICAKSGLKDRTNPYYPICRTSEVACDCR